MKTLIEGIMSTMNPFSIEDDNSLYCLSTGQKVPDAIKDDLLAFTEKGKKWSNEFSEGCFNDPYLFEKSIPRRKVKKNSKCCNKNKNYRQRRESNSYEKHT